MLATGGAMLPVPTSGSKDCAKAGSPMTLANVARIRIFFIAVSILEVLEPAFASLLPSLSHVVSSCFRRQTGHQHNEPRLVPQHSPNCRGMRELSHFCATMHNCSLGGDNATA